MQSSILYNTRNSFTHASTTEREDTNNGLEILRREAVNTTLCHTPLFNRFLSIAALRHRRDKPGDDLGGYTRNASRKGAQVCNAQPRSFRDPRAPPPPSQNLIFFPRSSRSRFWDAQRSTASTSPRQEISIHEDITATHIFHLCALKLATAPFCQKGLDLEQRAGSPVSMLG